MAKAKAPKADIDPPIATAAPTLFYFRTIATNAVHVADATWAAIFKSRKDLVQISKDDYDSSNQNS